jgi:GMP reductase
MRIEEDLKLDYKDVLIRPKRSTLASRKQVSLERNYSFRNSNKQYIGVPIMAANMDGVGTFEMADTLSELGLFTCLVKTYSVKELCDFFNHEKCKKRRQHVAYSLGVGDQEFEKLQTVMDQTLDAIKYVCIDVANGYSERFAEYVQKVRTAFPHTVIIAGNVVTGDMTQELILRGADIVKVGIGPGSVCTTRIQTGVGYPQLSAVMECADAAHGLGGHIIADGGCNCPGDVAKAFAGGADFVMLGGMLAGHDEGGGEVVTKVFTTNEHITASKPLLTQKKFVQFYGMSSKAANEKHFGGLKDYRSSEGREVWVDYRGPVELTVKDLLGGLRSTCTYVGANNLKQLSKCTTFVRCTQQFNNVFV